MMLTDRTQIKYGLFRYHGTNNLGDAIQSIALSRLLSGSVSGMDRGTAVGPFCELLIINGWLGNNQIPPRNRYGSCLFAGIHLAQLQNISWIRNSKYPVGARDPWTHSHLRSRGIRSNLIGCSTLTFPRFDGHRSGVYIADSEAREWLPESALKITHHLQNDVTWSEQWRRGLDVLEIYRTAEIVYTSRLHVLLPCLAFGTPVVFAFPDPTRIQDPKVARRMSLVKLLGIREGERTLGVMSDLPNIYTSFLEKHLGQTLREQDPVYFE